MGSMSLGELSIAGKIVIFILIGGLIGGGYYGYASYRYGSWVEKGNQSLSTGNYSNAISSYKKALDAKTFGGAQAEIASLINNATTLKESEITKLRQEIVAVIGDKYGGIEGSNTIAIRKGYYSAVEIESIQKKIDRLKKLEFDNSIIKEYQRVLNSQKLQSKRRK